MLPLYFKEALNLQVMIIKLANYHPLSLMPYFKDKIL